MRIRERENVREGVPTYKNKSKIVVSKRNEVERGTLSRNT